MPLSDGDEVSLGVGEVLLLGSAVPLVVAVVGEVLVALVLALGVALPGAAVVPHVSAAGDVVGVGVVVLVLLDTAVGWTMAMICRS